MMFLAITLALQIANPLAAQPLTLRVEGDGYLRFAYQGRLVFAKSASLTSRNGILTTSDGAKLWPKIVVPEGATKLDVSIEGQIRAAVGDYTVPLGQVVIALFKENAALTPMGKYFESKVRPSIANPGDGLAGVIRTKAVQAAVQTAVVAQKPKTSSAAQPFAESVPKASSEKTVIRIRLHSEVGEEYITLDKVAEFEGDPTLVEQLKAVDLGRTPIIGATRGLSVIQVKAMILGKGINLKAVDIQVPEGANVTRAFQTVEPEQILQVALEGIKRKFELPYPVLTDRQLQPVKVPMGEVKVELDQVDKSTTSISCLVTIKVNGARAADARVALIPDPNAVAVRQGDAVRLRLVSRGASIEVAAKVRVGGYVGQRITVETDAKTVHNGTLLSSGVVEVKI